MKRGGPPKRRVGLRRRKPIQRGRRKSYGVDDSIARRHWREQVTAGGCVMPGPHGGFVQGHHIITKDLLKREGHSTRLWDTRNGLALCEHHHNLHHRRLEPVPMYLLPEGAHDFAREVGLEWVLDRDYSAEGVAA